jgi:hypothetical protein
VIYGDIMVKIQLDLSKEEDRLVELYKLLNNYNTKSEAIKQMIRHFEVEIKPLRVKEKEYFK